MNQDPKTVDKAAWLEMLRCMTLSRLTEERMIRLYHQGRIFGGVYTGIGQEAIGAATTAACGPEDLFTPLIRDLTVHLGRGQTVLNAFRQFLGRAAGPTRGRDGNVHHGNMPRGVYAMISHLGAMLPVLIGGVMAKRKRGIDAVGIGYIGDGATSTGDFHEAVNFASVFDVPVIILIENNKYAYSTPNQSQFRCERLIDRAPGYGMEGVSADGNDLVGLHLLVRERVARMRKDCRPILLECDTMRMRGHGEHDDCSYVDPALKGKYVERDPLLVAHRRLTEAGILNSAEIEKQAAGCRQEVDHAFHQALAEPAPDPRTLLDGVYADT